MTNQQHNFALEFLRTIPLAGIRTLLDIGAGPGYQTQWFIEQGVQATAVDLQPPVADVPYIQGDAEHLPVPNGSADAVWTHHAFEHMLSPLRALAEVNRVLNPGGWLFFTVPDTGGVVSSGHINRYDMPTVIYHLAMCGFDCTGGYFQRQRSHLRAAVRKVGPATLETSVSKLLPLLPASCHAMIRETGRFDLASLETKWFP